MPSLLLGGWPAAGQQPRGKACPKACSDVWPVGPKEERAEAEAGRAGRGGGDPEGEGMGGLGRGGGALARVSWGCLWQRQTWRVVV